MTQREESLRAAQAQCAEARAQQRHSASEAERFRKVILPPV